MISFNIKILKEIFFSGGNKSKFFKVGDDLYFTDFNIKIQLLDHHKTGEEKNLWKTTLNRDFWVLSNP